MVGYEQLQQGTWLLVGFNDIDTMAETKEELRERNINLMQNVYGAR